jgi:uroporphyrinogen decarboxylase
LAYTRRVLQQLKRTDAVGRIVPRIVFTKGGGLWLESMRDLPCEVIGLDWTCSLAHARNILQGTGKALQGNIDPNTLFAPPEQIAKEVAAVFADFGKPHTGSGTGQTHIFNLGHGISQFTPPEHVTALVDTVKTLGRNLRAAA